MIKSNDKKFVDYCDVLVSRVYKVLPLFEEGSAGVSSNVESILIELLGLQSVVNGVKANAEYMTLITTISGLNEGMKLNKITKSDVKREIFKSINLIKRMKKNVISSGGNSE